MYQVMVGRVHALCGDSRIWAKKAFATLSVERLKSLLDGRAALPAAALLQHHSPFELIQQLWCVQQKDQFPNVSKGGTYMCMIYSSNANALLPHSTSTAVTIVLTI